jgi:cleavage and polyadenylation specificity factor subunit 1
VDVVEVIDAGSRYRRQLKLVVKEEGTAPVTAINSLSGYLIHAMGQKVGLDVLSTLQDVIVEEIRALQVFVKALDLEERLVAVAFLDVAVYVTSIGVLKNLILIGDQVKSVWFAAFQVSRLRAQALVDRFLTSVRNTRSHRSSSSCLVETSRTLH